MTTTAETEYAIEDYRNAPSGEGPLASEWADKPHRLLYDLCSQVSALLSENARLKEALEAKEDALHQIVQWADAYPINIFPEPDFARAHVVLKEHGMTLDAISASNMRHAVEGVGNIARSSLNGGPS